MNKIDPFLRVLRIILSAAAFAGAYFWLSGTAQIIAYFAGAALTVAGFFGCCGLFTLFRLNICSRSEKPLLLKTTVAYLIIFLIVLGAAGLVSIQLTKKRFLEDYGRMNGYYKQTLFLTGQNRRSQAIAQYNLWVNAYDVFKNKYMQYRPFVLKNDKDFADDLQTVSAIMAQTKDAIYSGDLSAAHKRLEEVRPLFQAMFKRNGFSLFAILLTDFHDQMEQVIEAADTKDSRRVIEAYGPADNTLRQIEAEQNNGDIQAIRENLNRLLKLAQEGQVNELSTQAAKLKSSFVKVYLQKG